MSPKSVTKRLMLPAAVIFFVLAVAWLPDLLAGTRFYSNSSGASESIDIRLAVLTSSIEQFTSNPLLGVGLGLGSGVMVPAVLAASGGLLLLLAYYVFVLAPIREMSRARTVPIVRYCLVSAIAVIAMGLFNNSVAERFDYWTLAIGFALAFGARPARQVRD